jgi:cleavage stimulation factor subunit 2
MAPDKGKSIFIGNIPFSRSIYRITVLLVLTMTSDMSEEEIVHMLSSAGTVTKFRLMTNPDTGKPKGFGFADFSDADSAASAVRNLNDHEIQGRKIRVDWPHNNEKDSVPQDYSQINTTNDMAGGAPGGPPALPPLPPGVDLPPNLKCADAISNTLKTLPPPQLLDILAQMKTLTMTDPETAKRLMKEAPQLAYAIFQALVLMNLVDPNVLATVVEQNVQASNSQLPMQQPQPPPIPQQPPQYGYPPPPAMQNRTVPTPQQYAPPPPQVPQSQAPPGMSPEQRQMLEQVMQLDQRTIDSLPPNERMQIMQLRQQYQQMGVR